jgi:hypothetical protein
VHEASKTGLDVDQCEKDDIEIAEMYFPHVSPTYQRRLLRQRRELKARYAFYHCWDVARQHGAGAARGMLIRELVRHPRLLRRRAVWGALRRWYGLGRV